MAPPSRNAKGGPARPPNPIRNQREIRAPTPLLRQATANNAVSRPAKRACPNKTCDAPNIVEGTCRNCGTIVEDNNIVSEISFGEDARGAAVVQGSYVGEGQSSARSMGPAFRRAAGPGEERESTLRDGKSYMIGWQSEFGVTESTVNEGLQIFKLASTNNFIQGRRIDMVAAVCLYSACRKNRPCKVMLIDFADKLQVNVFKLGHTFKALHRAVTLSGDGIIPILPEDLIYRFAFKLEFGEKTRIVADAAIRLSKRMALDWMAMGRRPSGVCGACIILAARMHNFRRTVTEVVYVVKVTTATIQKRLDEFKLTPSSALTVEEFMNNEFLESAHDPPSFYEKQEEFIKNKKTRKRKRRGQLLEDEEEETREGDEADPNKRQKTSTPNPDDAVPTVEVRRDAEGYAIPATPAKPSRPSQPSSEFDHLVDETMDNPTGEALEKLVEEFDEEALNKDDEDEDGDDVASSAGSTTSTPKRGKRRIVQDVNVPGPWAEDEERLTREMQEVISDPKTTQMISDPNTQHHAALYAMAEKRAKVHMVKYEESRKPDEISDSQEIMEYEFADDPEVQNCLLNAEDIAKKEKVWVNENKNWLRKQQVKEYQRRMAANGPPKRTRNRKRVPKIGELQTSPANSAGEAATAALKTRALSKKINYANLEGLFDDMDGPGGGALGSEATSRVTSRAGSSVPESPSASDSESVTNDGDSEMGGSTTQAESSTSRTAGRTRRSPSPPTGLVEDDGDGRDYVEDEGQPEWMADMRNRGVEMEDEEEFRDDYYDDDEQDFGDGGLEDMDGD